MVEPQAGPTFGRQNIILRNREEKSETVILMQKTRD